MLCTLLICCTHLRQLKSACKNFHFSKHMEGEMTLSFSLFLSPSSLKSELIVFQKNSLLKSNVYIMPKI